MSEQLEYTEERFDPTDWITTKEAAKLIGYTRDGVVKAVRSGRLNAIRRANALFYRVKDVLEYAQLMDELGAKKHTPLVYIEGDLQETAKSNN